MSWLYSQALVVEYLAGTYLDGEQSAPSSSTPTPQSFLSPDKMTAFSRLSRFGMTFAPLTDDLGEDVLTWFLAGFPVRTFQSQEKAKESLGSDPAFGGRCGESLAKLDPGSSLWKTRQLLLFEDSGECLEIWPDWGITQGTEFWAITPPAGVRKASASGLSLMRPIASDGLRHKFKLEHLIRNGHQDGNLSEQLARVHQVKLTPNAGEILMNWPLGWTDLKPLAMDRFLRWQNSHGKHSAELNEKGNDDEI
jgi:hypothetical protein